MHYYPPEEVRTDTKDSIYDKDRNQKGSKKSRGMTKPRCNQPEGINSALVFHSAFGDSD